MQRPGHPPAEPTGGDVADRDLVRMALEGCGDALDALVRRHQGFIYGVAVRMLWDPRDAEDVTQEVLVKIATGLSSFRGESAFRTWAYRIAVNHVLNCRRSLAEEVAADSSFFERKSGDPARADVADEVAADPEQRLLQEETRIACLSGMLLCLDRQQRILFILGEVFEIGDTLGGEILGITRDNYRQRLARARQQLYGFMRGQCGLADPANPCRCARKTKALIRAGIVDPRNLRFVPSHVAEVERSAEERTHALERAIGGGFAHLFRDQDRRAPPDLAAGLRALLSDGRFRGALDLDGEVSPSANQPRSQGGRSMATIEDYVSGRLHAEAKAVISLLRSGDETLAGTSVGEALLEKIGAFDPVLLPTEEAARVVRAATRCAVSERLCTGICPDAEFTESVLLDDLADALVAAGKARAVTKDEAVATLRRYERNPKVLSKASGKPAELCCTSPRACIYWNMERRGLQCVRRGPGESGR
jgi:RNA polymerase sigma factor (sigma-70 family)